MEDGPGTIIDKRFDMTRDACLMEMSIRMEAAVGVVRMRMVAMEERMASRSTAAAIIPVTTTTGRRHAGRLHAA